MPPDGRCALREHARSSNSSSVVIGVPAVPSGGSKLRDNPSAAAAEHQHYAFRPSQLVSKQYAVYWVVWLVLCGCFAIRHTTRLLDAAGSQHNLLAPPKTRAERAGSAAAAQQQQHLEQHHIDSSSGTSDGSSIGSSSNISSEAAILAAQQIRWPDGYVAVCAVIKDQWPDLRYWIEYHRWLGVSKFYIYDNNSTLPAMLMLWDYMQQGVVDYQYFLGRPRRKRDFTDTNQYRAYQGCLLQHFKQHRWLAFIDADEFFVFPQQQQQYNSTSSSSHGSQPVGQLPAASAPMPRPDQQQQPRAPSDAASSNPTTSQPSGTGSANSSSSSSSVDSFGHNNLPLFLSQFEGQPAIGVNWVLFGSSGHVVRPAQGPLAAYTACVPHTHWESTHVKVIANTGGVLGMGFTPHEVLTRSGRFIVDVDQAPFRGPKTQHAKWHKLVLHHYVLKSKAEFVAKNARGSGAGNRKDWAYWDYIEKLANETCTGGLPVSAAFLDSRPHLALPAAAHVLHGCHRQAVAAYEALLEKPLAAPDGGAGAQQQQQQPSAVAPGVGDLASADGFVPC